VAELCIRCQTPVVPGQDLCAHCGLATGVDARQGGGLATDEFVRGWRRRPGEPSTFVRARWLPAVVALFMFAAALAAAPDSPVAAPVVAVIAYALCTLVRARLVAMAKNESADTPVCPHCFAEYEIGDDYCPNCGKPVGEATSSMPFIPPPGEDFEEHDEDESA